MSTVIDANRLTGDNNTVNKREDTLGDLVFSSPMPKRCRAFDRGELLIRGALRRNDRARRDRVDQNLIGRQLQRKSLGERDDAGLRYVVRQEPRISRTPASQRPVCEIDDAASAQPPHVRSSRAR